MITLNTVRDYGANRIVLGIVCLTTDTFPTQTIEGINITNGSTLTVLNPTTKKLEKTMLFDEENRQWCEL